MPPRLPVISGKKLVKKLAVYGYQAVRIRGSHIRISTEINGKHSITIPDHKELDRGLLASIIKSVAKHHGISKNEVTNSL